MKCKPPFDGKEGNEISRDPSTLELHLHLALIGSRGSDICVWAMAKIATSFHMSTDWSSEGHCLLQVFGCNLFEHWVRHSRRILSLLCLKPFGICHVSTLWTAIKAKLVPLQSMEKTMQLLSPNSFALASVPECQTVQCKSSERNQQRRQ